MEPVAWPLLKMRLSGNLHSQYQARQTMNDFYHHDSIHRPLRIARVSYLVRWGLFCVGGFVASQIMDTSSVVLTGSGVGLLLFLFLGLFRWVLVPRLRDMGVEHAWAWSLLFFVHFLNPLFLLALLFVPTNALAKRSYVY